MADRCSLYPSRGELHLGEYRVPGGKERSAGKPLSSGELFDVSVPVSVSTHDIVELRGLGFSFHGQSPEESLWRLAIDRVGRADVFKRELLD